MCLYQSVNKFHFSFYREIILYNIRECNRCCFFDNIFFSGWPYAVNFVRVFICNIINNYLHFYVYFASILHPKNIIISYITASITGSAVDHGPCIASTLIIIRGAIHIIEEFLWPTIRCWRGLWHLYRTGGKGGSKLSLAPDCIIADFFNARKL